LITSTIQPGDALYSSQRNQIREETKNMKVSVFTLCDYARAEGEKMNIIGTFNTIYANQAPAVYPLCALAIIMRFEKIEEGPKTVRISLIDSDGKPVMPTLNAQLNVQFSSATSEATVQLALLIQQISLPRFGEYSIDLAVDGRQEASTPLYVQQVQTPPQGLQMLPQQPT
jgi:hypothetical protein